MEQPLERIIGMNPCADCSYPIPQCPWLHSGQEVDGWLAQSAVVIGAACPIPTFRILYCPLYRPPMRRKSARRKESANE